MIAIISLVAVLLFFFSKKRKKFYIFRGLPGSGKTTEAIKLVGESNLFEADQYFTKDGVYSFVEEEILLAHADCFNRVQQAMIEKRSKIAVANIFGDPVYMQPYIDMAKRYGYKVVVIRCTGEYGSIHNIPEDVLADKKARFQDFPGETFI